LFQTSFKAFSKSSSFSSVRWQFSGRSKKYFLYYSGENLWARWFDSLHFGQCKRDIYNLHCPIILSQYSSIFSKVKWIF
jgi:hypothetical protein